MTKINFRRCYQFFVLNVAIIIATFILNPLRIIPSSLLQAVSLSGALFLNLYAQLGYVKYSVIRDERQFRKVIIGAIGLSTLHSLLVPTNVLIYFGQTQNNIYLGIIMLLSMLLFYYAFALIRNDDVDFFKKLASLNLYLALILFLGLLCYVFELPLFLVFPIMMAGVVVIILLWYWQIKLFRHLSLKYNES